MVCWYRVAADGSDTSAASWPAGSDGQDLGPHLRRGHHAKPARLCLSGVCAVSARLAWAVGETGVSSANLVILR